MIYSDEDERTKIEVTQTQHASAQTEYVTVNSAAALSTTKELEHWLGLKTCGQME